MHYLLLLATASVAIAADANQEAHSELKADESALPIRVHDDDRLHHYQDGLELIRSRDERTRLRVEELRNSPRNDDRQGPIRVNFKDDDHSGPQILRSPDPLHSHGHPDIERQNRIIADVYSPDWYQPTWILDYRYLKTGGRDYTRGPGGQILILPKGVKSNEHKEFDNFDMLLEHLRLSRLAEHSKNRGRYGDDHDARRAHHNYEHEEYFRPHQLQHNPWKAARHH
ncbi:hypothetical protein B5X24_HaOG216954 [Helicoverpa armigera]|uniref:Uncharacterized protein n=1 Tax=Helicoverpa armigera TaxID=29058 RepID=A0A2W1C4A5_HELAM|nr:hypothetical protein B5X24_HaOG216954 [Helicoverpa armigera]